MAELNAVDVKIYFVAPNGEHIDITEGVVSFDMSFSKEEVEPIIIPEFTEVEITFDRMLYGFETREGHTIFAPYGEG